MGAGSKQRNTLKSDYVEQSILFDSIYFFPKFNENLAETGSHPNSIEGNGSSEWSERCVEGAEKSNIGFDSVWRKAECYCAALKCASVDCI